MPTRQPGLRKRMQLEARRIFHQREQLHELYALATKALGSDDSHTAVEALRRFTNALCAHCEIEEKTHFPALHGLSPATDERLARLVREHVEFRAGLARIANALRGSDFPAARVDQSALDKLVAKLKKPKGK